MARKKTAVEEPATEPVEGEVLTEEQAQAPADAVVVSEGDAPAPTNSKRRLKTIAANINREFGKGIDAQFAIGHLLVEARTFFPGDTEFGRWFSEQGFMFSQSTSSRLRRAAENEEEVRAFIAQSAGTGRDIGVATAVKELAAGPKAGEASEELEEAGERVRDLLKDEPEPSSGFEQWRTATENLNLQVLTVEELGAFAVLIQSLVAAYGEERKRRSA